MTDHLAETIAALWPTHKLPAPVVAEMVRRVNALPLSVEQIRAALTDYRIACGRYEQVTPDPGNIEARLRTAAFGNRRVKSPGSSEAAPAEFTGRRVSLREFVAYKKSRGEPVYPGVLAVASMSAEEVERSRHERETRRLAEYRRRG